MERFQLISFPGITSFFKAHEVPEKTSHLHPPPPHPPASQQHQASVQRQHPAPCVQHPQVQHHALARGPFLTCWAGNRSWHPGWSAVMISVLFSLPLYRRAILMHPHIPQDLQDARQAQLPSLIAAADMCQHQCWTARVSCSEDCCPHWHDPGMQAPEHMP